MLVPLSWLKEYVDIKIPLKELMWKMTEVGLTTESYIKMGNNIILDIEVTPNRPDWMSIIGVARELAAIQKTNVREPIIKGLPKPKKTLPMNFKVSYELFERWSAVVISDVNIGPSPAWLQERLGLIGLRPINNIVDITNYVMFEMGIPMHAFDYDEIKNHTMSVEKARGGEKFTTVDELSYKLPKDAMIIRDSEKIIDLVGIKGGLNSGIKKTTKNICLHVTIDNPVLIRRASQALSLRSEASAIYERGPNKGGTVDSLKRAANLILELAHGKIASEVSDLKKENFTVWELALDLEKLENRLGIKIPDRKVIELLSSLNLSPSLKKNTVVCTIPTFRGDLKIEEDLIEEVARMWGYNNFPKTLPYGSTPKEKVAYFFDPKPKMRLKELMFGAGFFEIQTLSLTSEEFINKSQLNLDLHIKIANPVSKEYEYLRTSLIPSLLSAIKLNSDLKNLNLYELNKVYFGPLDSSEEIYKLSGIQVNTGFREFKGSLDLIFDRLHIKNFDMKVTTVAKSLWHPTKSGVIEKGDEFIGTFGEIHPQVLQNFEIKEKVWGFELDELTLEKLTKETKYLAPNQYPSQIEDLTLLVPQWIKISDIISIVEKTDSHISEIELIDTYQKSYTFRIWYQDPKKTMSDSDVKKIHNKILSTLNKKFGVREKE